MKIVLLGPDAGRHKGGIAQFVSALAKNLSDRTQLFYFSWYQQYPDFLLKNSRDLVSDYDSSKLAKGEPLLGFINPISWLKFVYAVCRHKPEVIILNWAHPVHAIHYLLFIFLFRLFLRSQIILIVHNVEPHESFPGALLLNRLVMQSADRVIVHSQEEKTKALRLYPRVKFQKLFMPLFDFFPAAKKEVEPEPDTFLFFGIIRKYKGLEILLSALALAKAKNPQIKLLVAGEFMFAEDRRSCLELIRRLGLEINLQLIDRYINENEIPELFARAQAVVFPFISVTQSASLALAFAYQKAVLVSDLPAFAELVQSGVNGLIFEAGNPQSLADCLLKFSDYKWQIENLRMSGQSLSWDKYSELLLSGAESKTFDPLC